MAERKSVNKYYPPDWDPSKGTINQYRNSHPYGDRAKKWYSEGILVVRFEMPWNVNCTTCQNHIGKGVRYNAEKKKSTKMYFSSAIIHFTMKCHLCGGTIEIETDPKNRDFKIISGIKRKTVDTENSEIDEDLLDSLETEHLKLMESFKLDSQNPILQLLVKKKDIEIAQKKAPSIEDLYHFKTENRSNHAALNSNLRSRFRHTKNQEKQELEVAKSKGFHILLQPETTDDIKKAKSHMAHGKQLQNTIDKQQKINRVLTVTKLNRDLNSNSLSTPQTLEIIKKKVNIDPSVFYKQSLSNNTVKDAFSSSLFK
ncbi:hypothetical protein DLAC_11467 [Tieghemostelium lacteum]|uniref:Coiled-coil domain-containing protein 130 n=1 Tax=Tieghemostelium lacteum TaxID=361077 RepID=A0A152A7Z0_TIELA|nr:hypothetical protein DLAC_11467 [Tieghemostelium lacteum]|eukprot:KYR02360.1 hypothetical protein DLAC_11467 [Tieghemostelium lacteum]